TKSYSNRAQIGISKKVIPLWRPQTAGPPEHFVVFGRKIPRTPLIMILGILGCGKAFAATELQLQQKRVMHFCANASLPLLIAGTTYANTSDNGRPEKERVAILKNSVASSTAYKMASPGVQMAMMSVVEDIADPKELALHQKEVRRLGASYLSDSGVSWASKTVSPFTAWCNFNRLES
ncbi:hypothetical protein, partial [Escherichia coli]|uniref:hypothetical protein n=1 Tax=Escherichia coli TaxID=562 RepID=UPI00202BA5A6